MLNKKWTQIFIKDSFSGSSGIACPLPGGWDLSTGNITSLLIQYGSAKYDTVKQLAPNLWIAYWHDSEGKSVPEGWMNHCYTIHALEMAG
jgi:hypothetical protein